MKTENVFSWSLIPLPAIGPEMKRSHQLELIETALAHGIGDKAEQAYRRSYALEISCALMEALAGYCDPMRKANVAEKRQR